MATSASVRTGLKSLMQDTLSDTLVSTISDRMPWLYILLAKNGTNGKNGAFGFGIPQSGAVISGVPMSKGRMETIVGSDKYMPIVETSLPSSSDGKVLGMTDTMPTVADWGTNTPSSRLTRPFFKWVERADPIMVPKKEIRRTKRQSGQKASAAVGDLFRYQSMSVLATHLTWWNDQFWGASTVAPSSVDADVWDSPYSIAAALKDDNVYAGVDRATSNSYWRGNYDVTNRPADFVYLYNRANYEYGCANKGAGIDLMIVGADLFTAFMAQADGLKGTVVYTDGKLPGIGETGFTREIIRYRDMYILYDPRCPSKIRGDAANVAVGLNMKTWTVAVSPDANFEADEPSDLTKTEGGKDAIKSQIRTELIVACEAPKLNVYFSDVG